MHWRVKGNTLFATGDWEGALSAYTKGLETDPDNIMLLSNRVIVHLKLDNFGQALTDAEHVLLLDSANVKAKHRKGLALIELARYEEAIEVLSDALTFVTLESEKKAMQSALEEARLFQSQSETAEGYSPYAIGFHNKQPKRSASFTKLVKVENVEGKGRGLVAAIDIQQGQLVMVSKAFCYVVKEEWKHHDGQAETISGELEEKSKCLLKELMQKIVKKVKDQPESLADVMHLWAGPEMTFLEKGDHGTMNEELDMVRLAEIIQLNAYGHSQAFSGLDRNSFVQTAFSQYSLPGKHRFSAGLWLPLSYINHTCFGGNAFMMNAGDTVFLRALKLIPSGTEIVINYCPSTEAMSVRQRLFDRHGFVCGCPLCDVDKKEGPDMETARRTSLQGFFSDVESSDLKTLDDIYNSLEAMRKDAAHLNVPVLDVLLWLMTKATLVLDQASTAKYANRIFDLSFGTEFQGAAVIVAMQQFIHAVMSGSLEDQKLWAYRFRAALFLRDGSMNFMDLQIRHEVKKALSATTEDYFFEECVALTTRVLRECLSL